MEFYRSVDVGLSDEMRFNSQRDGILPFVQRSDKKLEQGFNSQRDGILREGFEP